MGTDPGLRILILSTPKTGNTWLRHLLAGEYRLPQFYVPPPLDCAKLDKAGERWVANYDIRPNRGYERQQGPLGQGQRTVLMATGESHRARGL